jgi:hypothetical protein
MGTCYVNVCIVFKVVVMVLSILGGLFQVFRWIITNFNGNFCISEKLLSL